jgi:LAO/AO transport system kinase
VTPLPLADRVLAGDVRAMARAISLIEDEDPSAAALVRSIFPHTGRAYLVGVTGPPGAGKSTLVNELARLLRSLHRSVGILAVDPSSPYSGGALLGDRIRMEERTLDSGVFIRSMASRGSHGGLARASVDACDVMDAFGFDEILLETVGVGQAEYDVVAAADTILVVLCPGAGDGVQAMKAGLLEVADVLVVNKSDVAGADRVALDLEDAVSERRTDRGGWTVPVVCCSAARGTGVADVLAAVEKHRAFLGDAGLAEARREKRVDQVQRAVGEALQDALWRRGGWRDRVATLLEGGRAPYDVASRLADAFGGALAGVDVERFSPRTPREDR